MLLFGNAAKALSRSIQAAAGGFITVQRGAELASDVPATRGQSTFQSLGGDGLVTEVTTTDFLILQTDYAFTADDPVLPQRGDLIQTTEADGATLTYEALPVAGGRVYSFSDSDRTLLRVHTKQVKNP